MWNDRKVQEFWAEAGKLGSIPGLDNIRNLMAELGDVQDQLTVIHVAGTNGKGSVCAMLESVLRKAGYRTGRYSTPAVFCHEEQFQVDGSSISKEEYALLLEEAAAACRCLTAKGLPHPTLFEIETAVAFLWFYRSRCRIVILETMMGGALDATNIIKQPLCSVITSVTMDHMAVLGDTPAKIALQKAGIIKEGCPVVTIRQSAPVEAVIKQVCEEKHAALKIADTEKITNVHYEEGFLVFDWENRKDIRLSLLGAYQPENAACVIKTIECIRNLGFAVSEADLCEGLKNTCWPGRFEILNQTPFLVIDGAHNEDAAKKLRKTLELGFTNRKIIYIIGVLADKEHEKILKIMLPKAERVYTVTPKNPRALPGEVLCEEARKYHDQVSYAPDIPSALRSAMEDAARDPEGMILAFGSLSYLGEVKRAVCRRNHNDRERKS